MFNTIWVPLTIYNLWPRVLKRWCPELFCCWALVFSLNLLTRHLHPRDYLPLTPRALSLAKLQAFISSCGNITWVSTSTSNSTCLLNSSSSMPTFLSCWMTPQHHLRLTSLISNIQWIDNSCWLHYLFISHSCPCLSTQPQRFNSAQALRITLLDNFNSLLMALHTLVFSYALTPLSPLNSLLPNQTLLSSGTQAPRLASK